MTLSEVEQDLMAVRLSLIRPHLLLRKWPNVMLGLMVMLRPCGARW